MIINTSKEKTIFYHTESPQVIKSANLVLIVDKQKFKYEATIKDKTISVKIPKLDNIFTDDKKDGNCFLEIIDIKNRVHNLEFLEIQLIKGSDTFPSEDKGNLIFVEKKGSQNETTISKRNIELEPVNFSEEYRNTLKIREENLKFIKEKQNVK